MSRAQSTLTVSGELANVTVVRANGERVELGKPGTLAFRVRLLIYKLRLRGER